MWEKFIIIINKAAGYFVIVLFEARNCKRSALRTGCGFDICGGVSSAGEIKTGSGVANR